MSKTWITEDGKVNGMKPLLLISSREKLGSEIL